MRLLLYDASNVRHEFNEPLGVEAIMGYLAAYHPDIPVDIRMWSMEGIPEQRVLSLYDVIGMSLPYHSIWLVREFYRRIDFSKQKLILGNSLATFGYKSLLDEFPQAICSLGEGEYTFLDITSYMRGLLPLEQVRNIAFRQGNNVVVTQRSELPGKEVPHPARPAQIMRFLLKNRGTFRLEASRGCDYGHCSFCYLRGKYKDTCRREIPEESVIAQIRFLSSLGVKNPYFTDEDFIGGNSQRIIRIAEQIIALKQKHDIDSSMRFFINIKAADVSKPWWPEVSTVLLRAGIDKVFVGIESGSTEQLKRYHKPANVEINRLAISRLREEGFDAELGFIFFDPLVTLKDLTENLNFIRDCQLYKCKIYLFDRLRVTIGSEYYDITRNAVSYAPLDANTLSFDYDFVNSDVQDIWDVFFTWKQGNVEKFYVWQLKTRGESNDVAIQEMLKTLNFLEYSVMRCLVRWKTMCNPFFLSVAKKTMNAYESLLNE